MSPHERPEPSEGPRSKILAAEREINYNARRCVKCRPLPSHADSTGLCPWHRAKDPDRYIDWLMRLVPNDTARGGGWQFQHPDGSWRVVEAMAASA